MPIDNSIVHQIHKKPDGQPASLTLRDAELANSEALEQLLAGLIEAYNSKPNKAWGYFHEESGAYPFSGWLQQLIDQDIDFVGFTSKASEQLKTLMEGSNLALGGHVLFIRYRQGMTAARRRLSASPRPIQFEYGSAHQSDRMEAERDLEELHFLYPRTQRQARVGLLP